MKNYKNQIYPTQTSLQPGIDYYNKSPKLKNVTTLQSLIGILLFVAKTVRLNIVQSVSMLSRFLKNPREIHMNVARRVLTFFYITKARALAC